MLGSAGMIVMDDTTDMVYQIWRLARFYAHESCAQCTQCREGTAWSVRILERILAGKGKQEHFQLLLDLSDNMRSEEHTSELQSRQYLVCRLLLEKKKY